MCLLSATAYSEYSQMSSISGGRLFHPQHENAPYRGGQRSAVHMKLFSLLNLNMDTTLNYFST
jgi:hypothetical protein